MQWWNVQPIYTKSRKSQSTHTDIRVAVLKSFNCLKVTFWPKTEVNLLQCWMLPNSVFFFFNERFVFSWRMVISWSFRGFKSKWRQM